MRLGASAIGDRPHVCAFFSNPDDAYRVLLPFIKDGLEDGQKAFHTIDPHRHGQHIGRLESAGINFAALRESWQFELRSWTETHLIDGRFDQDKTLSIFDGAVKNAKKQGFPRPTC